MTWETSGDDVSKDCWLLLNHVESVWIFEPCSLETGMTKYFQSSTVTDHCRALLDMIIVNPHVQREYMGPSICSTSGSGWNWRVRSPKQPLARMKKEEKQNGKAERWAVPSTPQLLADDPAGSSTASTHREMILVLRMGLSAKRPQNGPHNVEPRFFDEIPTSGHRWHRHIIIVLYLRNLRIILPA